ncbi:TonB-dependent siderophore receptor [Paracoccus aminophilus]|uniref:Iron complex outermembrane recepter protein n=1 Tax=Paracoccus aminophilus JCM 7686 TaxID=1367847 RepID=S5YSQ3_PARAH|nr:TonB-dependent siderophore receptor [Paracoccus aminophilus]AGT08266.1 iron complex outermembrane recepter protein [Paracoccus aminophilus JCM 7686]
MSRDARPAVASPSKLARRLLLSSAAMLGFTQALAAQEAPVVLDTVVITAETEGRPGVPGPRIATTAKGALKSEAALVDTPQSVSVVTRKTLQELAPQSVGQALTYSANTNGQRYGNDTRSDYFTIRGFSADLFLNGLRVPQIANQTGGYAGIRVEPYTLESIEVLRGPASALFGQSNVGGIVNMNSKTPQETAAGEAYLRAGSFGLRETGIDVTGPLAEGSNLSYRFVGVLRKSDNSFRFGKNDRVALAPSLTWRPSDATTLTVDVSYLKDKLGQPNVIVPATGSIWANAHGQFIPVDFSDGDGRLAVYDKEIASIGYRLEHRLSETVVVSNSLRYTYMDTDYRSLFTTGLSADEQSITRMSYLAQPRLNALVADLHVQADLATGPVSHRVIAGVDYQRQKLRNFTGSDRNGPSQNLFDPRYDQPFTMIEPSKRLDQTSYQLGLYVQDELSFDRFHAVAGLRYDDYKTRSTDTTLATGAALGYHMDGKEVTGRLGMTYRFDNGIAPYALYSTSFLPTLTLADTPLKPTKGELKEVGVKYMPENRPISGTLSYFEATQTNVVNRISGVYYQTDEIEVKGTELEVQASLTDRWHLNAALSHQSPKVTKSQTAEQIGKMPYTVPKKQASLLMSYDLDLGEHDGKASIGAGVRYVGETAGDTTNSFMVPSYTVADAFFSYENDKYRFQVNGYNLANKRYVAGCNSMVQCYFGAERTVTATLSMKW